MVEGTVPHPLQFDSWRSRSMWAFRQYAHLVRKEECIAIVGDLYLCNDLVEDYLRLVFVIREYSKKIRRRFL